ncbi:hypothetical protein FOZ60_011908 [Perkinsus olseni]|uniref:Uncharacterized protein n=1 Tax=Perkinsus olseni TaxID=32597 RepID=A0A7J6NDT0_PEROL|nr:hypothetical protein FOZ60_011908 [Perkinsus olseni]
MSLSIRNAPVHRLSNWFCYGVFFVSALQFVLSGNSVRKSASASPTTVTSSIIPGHHTKASATTSPPHTSSPSPPPTLAPSPPISTSTVGPSPTAATAGPVTAAYSRPFEVTADYPAGCRGGMGPGENGKSKVLTSPGSCVYIMKGRNRDGVQQESVGFKLASDRRLSDGALEVQLNLVQDDSDEGPRVSVDISGRVKMEFSESDGTSILWELLSKPNKGQEPGEGGEISMTSHVDLTSSKTLHTPSTPFFPVEGDVSSDFLGFQSFEAASDQSFSAIPVISLRRKGRGWTYQVALQVKGSLGAYKDLFSHMVAITGVLYD